MDSTVMGLRRYGGVEGLAPRGRNLRRQRYEGLKKWNGGGSVHNMMTVLEKRHRTKGLTSKRPGAL